MKNKIGRFFGPPCIFSQGIEYKKSLSAAEQIKKNNIEPGYKIKNNIVRASFQIIQVTRPCS